MLICCCMSLMRPTPNYREQIGQVQQVLAEIGASAIPQVLVFNKLDAIEPGQRPLQLQDHYEVDGQMLPRIFVQRAANQGLDALRRLLTQRVLQAPAAAREFSDLPPICSVEPDKGENLF